MVVIKGSRVMSGIRRKINGPQAGCSRQTSDDPKTTQILLPCRHRANESYATEDSRNRRDIPIPGILFRPSCSIPSHMGESVLSQLQNYSHLYTFRDALRLFAECDVDAHFDLMKSTILKYSFKIYGLPECHREDLFLAVHFFLEEVFGVESKLELCVTFAEDHYPNVVGVVLDRITTQHEILMMANCLEGTDVELKPNEELDWILDGFIFNRTLLKDLTKKPVQ